MVEPETLAELTAVVVAVLGGQEGIKYVKQKARNGSKFVTEKFCGERHGHVEKMLDEVRGDVKTLLKQEGGSK